MSRENNIFITGSSGFVGKNLLKYLDDYSLNYKKLDLREQLSFNSLDGSSSVIHLAGKAHDFRNVSNTQEYYEVNFELTKKIYDLFLKSEATNFFFLSSVKAAADKVEGPLTENSVSFPETDYGKSKLMAEQYIQSQILPEGKSFYILRPCMIHGPGNKGNLNLLYEFVRKGIPYPFAAFKNQRSFLSVENLCFILKEFILQNNIPSGVYLVADDGSLSTNEIISLFCSGLGKDLRLWKVPKMLIRLLARAGDFLPLPINTERLDKLTENYVVCNHKVKEAINKSLPLTITEGLTLTLKSFQGRLNNF
ncbi:NAD-dependent epimerase/dehydratase family protein [Pedobacter nutrimenti]|uniref:Nucleoside-diphosphate-sugar epimerase n=1 Tax=Pedobacter nutrimenti TaxID=1241337 RepID=A0A318UGH0_9SPHI|nr:NAD-dependent epimerase/dehydratase family protein [Pedobacter nutrimenti]PYF75452.1 nucleoside-diphosphate-sugar epimerase [Pedobacter nutrimenti]